MADLTLDIPEVQVLVNYPNDPGGFNWHHRILLHRIQGGLWIALSPDFDLVRHDLNNIGHRVLLRRGPFPDDLLGEIYAFDPVGRTTLQGYKRQAKVQAAILGDGDVDDTESHQWLVSEPGHESFGKEVDEALLNSEATGMTFATKGVVIMNGEEVFIEKVLTKDLDAWKREKGLETGDLRLLGDHKDAAGKRRLDLSTAVALMKWTKDSEADPEFPIQGTRASKEYREAVATGTAGFLAYHEQWLRQSGVQKRSSAAHIHRNLSEALRFHSWDQIDGSATAVGEHLTRWAIQTELAVERNPSQPDYSGLDIISGAALTGEGRAAASRFGEWVTSRLKERSQIWKQERLYAQERRAQKGYGKGGHHHGKRGRMAKTMRGGNQTPGRFVS